MRLTEELSFVAKLIFFFLHRSKKNICVHQILRWTHNSKEYAVFWNRPKTIQPYLYNEEEIPPSLIKTKPNNNKKQTNKTKIRTNEALKQGIKRSEVKMDFIDKTIFCQVQQKSYKSCCNMLKYILQINMNHLCNGYRCLCVVCRGTYHLSGETKDYGMGICSIVSKHAA